QSCGLRKHYSSYLFRVNGRMRSQLLDSPAIGKEGSEQAEQHNKYRHYRQNETQPLKLEVHKIGDDQGSLYDRQAHQDDQHKREIEMYVSQEDLDGGQPEEHSPDYNVLPVAAPVNFMGIYDHLI